MDAYRYWYRPGDAPNRMLEICAVDDSGAYSTMSHEQRSSVGTPQAAKNPLNVSPSDGGWRIGKTKSSFIDPREEIRAYAEKVKSPKLALGAGQHHSRIWKGGRRVRLGQFDWYPCPLVEDLPTFSSFLEAIHRIEILCADLEKVFRTIHPAAANANAFGGNIRELLILAATEVEYQWRSVLEANQVSSQGSFFRTNDYVKLLNPMKLSEYKLSLTRFPSWQSNPFGNWDQAKPTQSLEWYDAYNATKHDAGNQICAASLSHTIDAVAACIVMLAAQHGLNSFGRFEFRTPFNFKEQPEWPEEEWYAAHPHKREWEHVNAVI